MAKAFETWTVCKNRPIEKLSENLWTVSGLMPDGKIQRRMAVARLDDGRLIVHNAIALDEVGMAELDAFGQVAAIVVPNAFHRQDARIWKDRYPKAQIFCPGGATKGVAKVVDVDGGDYGRVPSDGMIRLTHFDGMKDREGVMEVRGASGVTVIVNDALMNMPPMPFPMSFMMHPTGHASVPRFVRWMMAHDKRALAAHLERLADTPDLERVVFGHGPSVTDAPAELLRAAARELVG